MQEWVELYQRRNRGWPWPEDSWGLDSIYGVDGWCRACGIPQREQCGPLTLQRKEMGPVTGAWIPYWQYDRICLEHSLADQVANRFSVKLRDVAWHGDPPGRAMQIDITTAEEPWFDHAHLADAAAARHDVPGAACPRVRRVALDAAGVRHVTPAPGRRADRALRSSRESGVVRRRLQLLSPNSRSARAG
jgi:hypothetical protein